MKISGSGSGDVGGGESSWLVGLPRRPDGDWGPRTNRGNELLLATVSRWESRVGEQQSVKHRTEREKSNETPELYPPPSLAQQGKAG